MSETKNLKLYKHDEPLESNENAFDIDKALSKNWDKVDEYIGKVNTKIQTLETENTKNKQDISNIQAEQGTQNTTIESLQKENAEIKEENSRLKEDLNAFPTVNGSGEYVTLDTADSRFKEFKIFGKSWQETRSGKNAIIFEDVESTISGVAYSIKNGVVTLNGTATGVMNIYSKPINLLAGDYTLSKNVEGTFDKGTATSTPAILLQKKQEDGSYQTYSKCEIGASAKNNFISKTLEKGTYRLRIFTATGNILNNFSWKPQLEQGAVFSGFEQGGAMPSAEFPSEIRNVGDNVNLFNKDGNTLFEYDVKLAPIENGIKGTLTVAGTSKYCVMKLGGSELLGKTLIVHGNAIFSGKNDGLIGFYFGTNNDFVRNWITDSGIISKEHPKIEKIFKIPDTFPEGSDTIYILLYANARSIETKVGDYVEYRDFKIEEGTQATAYSPYDCGNIEIVIRDKNLLDAEKIVKDSNNYYFVYFDENKNVVFTTGAVPVIVRPVKIKEKTEYTYILRCKSNTTKLNNINFIAKYTDESQEVLSANKRTDTNEFVAKFKTNKEKTLDYVTQEYTNSASTTLIADASMILEGDYSNVNIELNNAKKQAIVFPFKKGQRLMEGDYLAEDGIHHKRKQIVIDNNCTIWNVTIQDNELILANIVVAGITTGYYDKTPLKICNLFKNFYSLGKMQNDNLNTVGYALYSQQIWIRSENVYGITTEDSAETRISKVKLYLEKQNLIAEYELAEEEVEPYTDEQKEAWKQIKNAKSYEGQTNIFSTDEISPDFEVTARRNLNAILNSLQAQILAN